MSVKVSAKVIWGFPVKLDWVREVKTQYDINTGEPHKVQVPDGSNNIVITLPDGTAYVFHESEYEKVFGETFEDLDFIYVGNPYEDTGLGSYLLGFVWGESDSGTEKLQTLDPSQVEAMEEFMDNHPYANPQFYVALLWR